MEETKKHSIYLSERKEVIIEGVLKLDSFDKNEFLIDTTKGFLHIQGKDLSLGNMDTEKQTLTIEGLINSFSYLDNKEKEQKESFLKRLFK
jgi:sporulation protein YabP